MLRWLLAAIHLLALGIGLGAVWARGRALRQPLDARGFRRVFEADAWWGIAALLWVGSGLWRWLAGTEKATSYYTGNHIFLGKMALFVIIVLLELSPMMALMNWRRQVAAGQLPDVTRAAKFARISSIQAGLIVLMVLAATAMARGYGARP